MSLQATHASAEKIRECEGADISHLPMQEISTQACLHLASIPRILLAEDNKVCQELVRLMLKQSGLKVDIVCNGAEAIEALSKTDYSLVLMDCIMPEMGGIEATRLIREGTTNARDPKIPIIAITADAFQTNADACKLAGMNDFITKPVSAVALREAVQKWLAAEPQFDEAGSTNRTICT
jgi:CheY-like chemotaxis protein